MKLAFIDNLSVGGGLSRFSLKLCESLVNNYTDLQIDYFIHHNNLNQIPEIKALHKNVNVIVLKSTMPKNKILFFVHRVSNKLFNKKLINTSDIVEIEKLIDAKYDCAYFPCAHMMKMPKLTIPIVGTIHDFNWRYFFGTEIFENKTTTLLDKEIQNWLNNAHCISSSNDVVNEAKLMYPNAKNYPAVIPIAQVVINEKVSEQRASEILENLKIDYPYIIFPGNFYPHKNHLNLFTAFYLLKQNPVFKKYKLVLTGGGTANVAKAKATYIGVRKILNTDEDYDVIGLGYLQNETLDALIMKANLLVSPSIYEAICTPAMDAWSFATPTAISDIAPFREHETTWGIKSAFFDPMNPHNIAAIISNSLMNIDDAKENAIISQKKLAQYSWDKIASSYMNIFLKASDK